MTTVQTFSLAALQALPTSFGPLAASASLQGSDLSSLLGRIAAVPGVASPLRVLTSGTLRRGIELSVFDNHVWSPERIDRRFTYAIRERLDDFGYLPDVRSDDGAFRRPLLYASFGQLTKDILFLGLVETNPDLRGRGVGEAFYEELISLAERGSYRFVGHYHNDLETAGFFLRRGCFFLDEIGENLRDEFLPIANEEKDAEIHHTVHLVEAGEDRSYVPDGIREASMGQRLQWRESRVALDKLFRRMKQGIEKLAGAPNEGTEEAATLIEIAAALHADLPSYLRLAEPDVDQLDTESPMLAMDLTSVIRHLENHRDRLAQMRTAEEIKEDAALL